LTGKVGEVGEFRNVGEEKRKDEQSFPPVSTFSTFST
jgi:hypothetical protein